MRDPKSLKILKDEECLEVIRKKLHQESIEHYSLVNYKVLPLSAVNGFMGQYFLLKATVTNGDDRRKISFFTKLPPQTGSPQLEYSREMGTFDKEIAIYTNVFPQLLTERRCVPQCFLGLEDTVMVLEDMSYSGFEMTNKYVPFDYEHCAILIKTIGEFHARCMIFEQLYNTTLGEQFSYCLQETLWPTDKARGIKMFRAAVKGSMSLIDLLSDLGEEQKRTFKEIMDKLSADHAKKLLPSKKFKNVLCHGDLWANNILFKYDNGKPTECCLIDFQLARYNPPAHDILCFLQFSTTRQMRSEHLDELLRTYYKSVSSSLKASSLDAATIFPWQELCESIKELCLVCMLHGVLNTPVMLLDEAAVGKYFVREPDLLERVLYVDRTPLVCAQYEEVPAYRQRLREALLELHDFVCA